MALGRDPGDRDGATASAATRVRRAGHDVLAHSARRDAAAGPGSSPPRAGRRVPPVPPRPGRIVASAWNEATRRGARPGEHAMSAPAIALAAVDKSFGATEIIRGVDLDDPGRRAPRDHRPERRRQVDAVQPDQRPLRAERAATIRLNGEDDRPASRRIEINRRGLSRSFQVTNIFPRLSVFENLRCAVLWSLGYRYSFWRGIDALPRSRERDRAASSSRSTSTARRRRAGRRAHLCRAARARDRHHHRRRRRRHPARRADRRHEPQRDRRTRSR